MAKISPATHLALEALLERRYSAVDPLAVLFTEEEVLGFMGLAYIGGGAAYPRMVDIAASAFQAWPVEQQELFTETYDVPTVVRDKITLGTATWPEQLSFDEPAPAEMTAEQLAAYKQRKTLEIDLYAEEQSLRIMTPGFGKVLTYVWKVNEAQKLLAQLANSETPNMAEYPFISAEIGSTAADAAGVATVIMQTAYVWVNCRATMEGAIFASRVQIAAAAAADVQGIVDATKATIKAAADYVIELQGNVAPVAVDDAEVETDVNVAVTFDPRANDTDANEHPLAVTAVDGQAVEALDVVNVTNGTVTLNADGTLTFTPATDYTGVATFTYTVSDGYMGTDTATVTVTVNALP